MNWLRNFMFGRNGVDHLSIAAVLLGLLISIITSFIGIPYLRLLPLIPYGYGFFRVLSRNVYKRQAENRKFLSFWLTVKSRFNNWNTRRLDKAHKYFTCPSCKASLRVPRGKGKVIITCPRCRHEITGKT
ncbi:MAG: hypothetical protein GX193_09875 [Clostridiales bacterium]|nr:hypothetical protein [Clostridiales bacterium]